MSSGPVLVSVLEGEDAIAKHREVMGATNPAEAAEGTIRKRFASSIDENAVHGSDGPGHREAGDRVLLRRLGRLRAQALSRAAGAAAPAPSRAPTSGHRIPAP